jgi:hypothetical protein
MSPMTKDVVYASHVIYVSHVIYAGHVIYVEDDINGESRHLCVASAAI